MTKVTNYQFLCSHNKAAGLDKIISFYYLLDGDTPQLFINETAREIDN